MLSIYDILKKLYSVNSPSGFEGDMAKLIRELLSGSEFSVKTDVLGNVIVRKKGPGKKCLLDAHMDTTGFLATYIDDNGFIRADALGSISVCNLHNTPVEFSNGTNGVISFEQKTKLSERKLSSFFIDIGAKDAPSARKRVLPGDAAVFSGKPKKLAGGKVMAPYLDNRIGCALLLYALLNLKESAYDIYAVFSSQEEVGLRGAMCAAYDIDADFSIVIDVTDSCDTPGFDGHGETKLGGGAAIKIMDSAVISHPAIVSALCETAEAEHIAYQRDIVTAGGTNGGSIHTSRSGIPTGGISIPTRYIHSPCEVCDMADAKAAAKLLLRTLETQAIIL